VDRLGKIIWVNNHVRGDVIKAIIYNNSITILENIMSYATGKQDASDFALYQNQNLTDWAHPPVTFCPVKLEGGGVKPAQADDEVLYGVIHSSQAVYNDVTDPNTGVVSQVLAGYDIKILIAESDVDASHGYANSDGGAVLFVQNYTISQTSTFADMYSMNAPSTGFTHPLFIIVDSDTLHYNGTIRPEAV
jgi:hypothetical protein